ncbi:bifunctional biotin--[acetyl-CoA-carboxylase] ligase/biotin operon repressor BirA [Aquipseudomonas ullengensis]|uniref:Bifunctional ligase/repressor BirA n=1 Tax=Aquipseudomonas ullengensis TaxID=2759166 RepID=A0A7W4LL91_9GAMM|nr:bifunctional biotin--[acetyl-CoA-carboxylase] ligase/biotin operon repressor BirA [Pseudomonas ullengensis]MBB2495215.1 bifunctional biotin--[acetyl-CoA-carboxylase] ligase/biotin operon repressor BirA [Pseudomonas ullengensis]
MHDVLKLLKDGEFHSGEALGAILGVSRATVWKRLQHLESDLGLVIHSVRGRGYRLASPISLLDYDALAAGASGLGWSVCLSESLDSTNAEVLRQLSNGVSAPLLVVAETQSSGRGRRGRLWASPFAENLYYSLGLRIEGGAYPLEGLSLSVGLAVLRALREAGCVAVGLKWPNDVLVSGRKIAGVLLELSGDPAGSCQVVIGIGVNANMLPGRADIDQPWTSLRQELGSVVDRTALVLGLSRWLQHYLDVHRDRGFSALRDEWQAVHLWQGREVVLSAGPQQIEGVVLGVDGLGALRLDVAGEERSFSGGELSLRLRNDS